jgi:phosphoglycerate dehydrogenase-like enzyme
MEQAKPKAIFLCRTDIISLSNFQASLESNGVFQLLDAKIVESTAFNPKPFGEAEDVEILGVNWGMTDLVEILLKNYPKIKWVHSFSAGVDTFTTEAIKSHPSVLTNAKGAYSEALAEFVAFQMLWFCKRGAHWIKNKNEKKWEKGFVRKLSAMTLGKWLVFFLLDIRNFFLSFFCVCWEIFDFVGYKGFLLFTCF